jgi:hypothetical protein
MIRHILKLLWNTKRQYAGILTEQGLIMFVLMFCMVKVAETVKQSQDPGMLNIDNTFACGYMMKDPGARADIIKRLDAVTENLKKLPYVEHISHNRHLTPFVGNTGGWQDSVRIDGKAFRVVIKASDEYGALVFQPVMEEGKWLDNKILDDGTNPVVINRQFAEKAGWDQSVGKRFQYQSHSCTVVGVTSGFKSRVSEESPAVAVMPMHVEGGKSNSAMLFAVRLKSSSKADFYSIYHREFKRLIPSRMAEPAVTDLEKVEQGNTFGTKFKLFTLGFPTLFLTVFAFIGTFGLFWLHARKSFGEFALRIALGSTKKQLTGFVLVKSLAVTVFAMSPALLLSSMLFDCTAPQVMGIAAAIICMLLFATVSAWYPAWKVSRVNPAEALQYE